MHVVYQSGSARLGVEFDDDAFVRPRLHKDAGRTAVGYAMAHAVTVRRQPEPDASAPADLACASGTLLWTEARAALD